MLRALILFRYGVAYFWCRSLWCFTALITVCVVFCLLRFELECALVGCFCGDCFCRVGLVSGFWSCYRFVCSGFWVYVFDAAQVVALELFLVHVCEFWLCDVVF